MFVDDMTRIPDAAFSLLDLDYSKTNSLFSLSLFPHRRVSLFLSVEGQADLLDEHYFRSFPSISMIRRQLYLAALFTLIYQLYFSASPILSANELPPVESNFNANQNKCAVPSIDEFPTMFFTDEQRRRGGVLLHIALILYSFAAIEIVCDDYFASALEKISYNLNLTPVKT